MKIRKARTYDVLACIDIEWPIKDNYRKTIKTILSGQIRNKNYSVFVAEIKGKIVGFVVSRKIQWNNSMYIERLYVDQDYRGQGIGSILLSKILKRKFRIIFVDLPPENKRAMKFYIRNGFKKSGFIKDFYNDKGRPNATILSRKTK